MAAPQAGRKEADSSLEELARLRSTAYGNAACKLVLSDSTVDGALPDGGRVARHVSILWG